MIPTLALSTLALFLTAGTLSSAAPVLSNSTVVVADPAIASHWGQITSGAALTGPAFDSKVPDGAEDTHELGVRDNADYTDVRRCPGGSQRAVPSLSRLVLLTPIRTRTDWGGAQDCTFEPLVCALDPPLIACVSVTDFSPRVDARRKSGIVTSARLSSTVTGSTSAVAPSPLCVPCELSNWRRGSGLTD